MADFIIEPDLPKPEEKKKDEPKPKNKGGRPKKVVEPKKDGLIDPKQFIIDGVTEEQTLMSLRLHLAKCRIRHPHLFESLSEEQIMKMKVNELSLAINLYNFKRNASFKQAVTGMSNKIGKLPCKLIGADPEEFEQLCIEDKEMQEAMNEMLSDAIADYPVPSYYKYMALYTKNMTQAKLTTQKKNLIANAEKIVEKKA